MSAKRSPVRSPAVSLIDDSNLIFGTSFGAIEGSPSHVAATYMADARRVAHDHTLTSVTASDWTWTYDFAGFTRIELHGAILPWIAGTLPVVHFTMDNGAPVPTVLPNTSEVLNNFMFYASEALSPGPHTLTVNVFNASVDAPFLIDFLLAYHVSDVLVAVSEPSSSTSLASSASSGTAESPTSTGSNSQLNKFPVGPVVGGIVAGVVILLLLAAILAILYLRWRRHNAKLDGPPPYDGEQAAALSYPMTPSRRSQGASESRARSTGDGTSTTPDLPPSPSSSTRKDSGTGHD
ncbi:hypothetical protein OH77DRAFT_524430 [Trametes cingulata]|nr:hypothetical protein OH77DRAFT_524430 [Trametes cingulata]